MEMEFCQWKGEGGKLNRKEWGLGWVSFSWRELTYLDGNKESVEREELKMLQRRRNSYLFLLH